MMKSLPQNGGDNRILRLAELVVHPFPLPSCGNNLRAAEISKVPRDLRLTQHQHTDEVTDAGFALEHEIE